MNLLMILVFLPIIVGIVVLFCSKWGYGLSLFTTIVMFLLSILLYYFGEIKYESFIFPLYGINFVLKSGTFSSFCVMFSTLMAMFICLYSTNDSKIFNTTVKKNVYFSLLLINLGVANGIFFANNFLFLIIFWELAGVIVYLMVRFLSGEENYKIATKVLYIIGFSDFCFLLGVLMLVNLTKNTNIGMFSYGIYSPYLKTTFVLLIIGALGKVGAIPFHTWIPEVSTEVPITIITYLVGFLDKLLGIYLLSKICGEFFYLSANSMLMIIGILTIMIGVFMALAQHNLKKLLSYHSISQVGYMILGIGSGSVIGFAGGIFHMINNVIYKSCLFLSCGAVESRTGTTDLSKTGGLGKFMPITFFATTVAALSISGIPPFNGFFSKWMIYQGLVERLQIADYKLQIVGMICLIGAMFGSGLTLASFIKVIYSVFLGENISKENSVEIKEVSFRMWLPMVVLSTICIIFGIFVYEVPLQKIIYPILKGNSIASNQIIEHSWQPYLATVLIFLGIIIGVVVYIVLNMFNKKRIVGTYLYGEEDSIRNTIFSGTDFYLSIMNTEPFTTIYFLAKKKLFDFYNWGIGLVKIVAISLKFLFQREIFDLYFLGKKIFFGTGKLFSNLHNGSLHRYLSWAIVGFVLVLVFFLK